MGLQATARRYNDWRSGVTNPVLRALLPRAEEDAARWRRDLMILGGLVAFPNVVFWTLELVFFMERPPFDIDYFWLAALFPWLRAVFTGIAYVILILFDAVIALAPSFHFKASSVLESVFDVFSLDPANAGKFVAVALVILAVSFFLAWRLTRRAAPVLGANLVIAALGLMIVTGDGFLGGDRLAAAGSAFDAGLAVSATAKIAGGFAALEAVKRPSAFDVPSATSVIFDALEGKGLLPKRVVLVVVESLGVFADDAANALMFAAFHDAELQSAYRVELGNIDFVGSTVAAELRELCQIQVSTVSPRAELLPIADCLPALLHDRNYHSLALHGFPGSFFDRQTWYDRIGFDDQLFMEEMGPATGEDERCGKVYKGICDYHIVDFLGNVLDAMPDRPLFLYWLTLNGHVPMERPKEGLTTVDCEGSGPTSQSRTLCRSVQTNEIVLSGLADLALDEIGRDTAFIVVGDHMPPFPKDKHRDKFSDTLVPYVILMPRAQVPRIITPP